MKVSAIAFTGLMAFAQIAKTQDVGDDIKDTVDNIGDDLGDIGDNLGDGLGDAFDNIKDDVSGIVDDIKTGASGEWSEIRASATQHIEEAKSFIATATGDAREQATELFGSLTGAYEEAVASASDIVEENTNDDDNEDAAIMQSVGLGMLGVAAGAAVFMNL